MTLSLIRYGPLPGLWEAAHGQSSQQGGTSSPEMTAFSSGLGPSSSSRVRGDSVATVPELRLSFKLGIDGPIGVRQQQQQSEKERQPQVKGDPHKGDPQEGTDDHSLSSLIGHQQQPTHEIEKNADVTAAARWMDDPPLDPHLGDPPGGQRAQPLWVQGGPGPTAKQMLHKLRYA